MADSSKNHLGSISTYNTKMEGNPQLLTLKLSPIESKLNNVVLYEPIDTVVLDKLINSDLLLTSFHNPTADLKYSNEREQLIAYKKLIRNGKAEVKYVMTKGISYGRVNPTNALGLFSIRRQIRHTLAINTFTDIDIENAHPSILLQICKANKIECDNLEDYVVNRNKLIKSAMEYYGVDREAVKKLYIKLLYFGSFESWAEELGIDKTATKDIKNFKKEINEIGQIIFNNNKLIQTEVKKKKKDQKIENYNEVGSVVSYYLQEYERRILETIYFYCVNQKIIKNNVAVLCADGLMIPTENFNTDLLDVFNKIIYDTFSLNLRFTTKDMNEGFLDILDEHTLSESEIIKKLLVGYKSIESIDTEIEFNKDTLDKLFFEDIEQLGTEQYQQYLEHTNSFRYFNAYHAQFYIGGNISKIYKNTIINYSDFSKAFNHLHFMEGKTKHKFTTLYEDCKHKKSYSTIHFEPNLQKDIGDKYNLFRGFIYDSSNNEYDMDIVKPYVEHIKYICGSDDIANYLLDWFAHIIQKPYIKTKVAVVLFSTTEGVGKNIISDIFEAIIKGYSAKISSTEGLVSKFNADMMAKLFVVGDEINGRASDVANELKDIITRNIEVIEMKGRDKFQMDDYKNYFLTTNNENVFKVSNSDRRFMFIEAPDVKKSREYYANLFSYLDSPCKLKHIYNYFKTRNISSFEPSNIYETDYKKRLLVANAQPYIKFVKDEFPLIATGHIRTNELYKMTIDYAKKNRMSSTYTEALFNKEFKKIFLEFNKLNKNRQSVYCFETIKEEHIGDYIHAKMCGLPTDSFISVREEAIDGNPDNL